MSPTTTALRGRKSPYRRRLQPDGVTDVPQYGLRPEDGETLCVITTHNYAHWLGECIESCLSQTLPFSKVVVVDDNSEDNALEVVSYYPVPAIRGSWRNVSLARTAGYEGGAGSLHRFVLFVDADNRLLPTYHRELRKGMVSPDVGVCYCQLSRFDEESGVELGTSNFPQFDYDRLRVKNYVDTCSLIRTEAFEQAGGWMGSSAGLEDWSLWLRITQLGWYMERIDTTALRYRVHPNSMIRQRAASTEREVAVMREAMPCAIITLFSGRDWSLNRYFDSLYRLDWDPCFIVAVDNSRSRRFNQKLSNELRSLRWPHILLTNDVAVVPDLPSAALADNVNYRLKYNYAMQKHLANLYAQARAALPSTVDLVWTLEDDIEPPPHTLNHLAAGLYLHPNAAAVTSCVESRFHPGSLIAWQKKQGEGWSVGHLMQPPPEGAYQPVDTCGFHSTLFRRADFDSFAFRPSYYWTKEWAAYDWAACRDLRDSGRELYISGSVRAKHWQADGTFVGGE